MKFAVTIFRGIVIGFKSIVLFYLFNIISMIAPNKLFFPLMFPLIIIFGILNGFIDIIIIRAKNTLMYKIFSGIFGFIFTVFLLFLSLRLHLPDILADYFIYGEGGGGLEAGGWFAFNFCLLIYFGTTLIFGYPIGMLVISHKESG